MSRIFSAANCGPATVYDVDTLKKIGMVLSIDTHKGEVTVTDMPLRVVGDEIAHQVLRYRAIHPIYGGNRTPVLFHCYGRQAGG